MRFKPVLTAAALAAALVLTGCSSETGTTPTATPTDSATPATVFIADGVYEFMFTEKTFIDAEGAESLPISANGIIQFKDGQCALDMAGTDVAGNEFKLLKPLGKNGWVFDSLSKSWTEMGAPYVPVVASAYPSIIAFNRAAGEAYSFCALAAFGSVSQISPEDPALYVSTDKQNTWILENIQKYAEGIADAAGLEGADRESAISKIVSNNSFGSLPENRIRIYDLAGLVTIEDATEASTFKIEMIRLDSSQVSDFAPALPEGTDVTTIEMLAKAYIDSLK